MKFENQFTNVELSKRLRDANVKQDGAYWWITDDDEENWRLEKLSPEEHLKIIDILKEDFPGIENQYKSRKWIAAFSVAELGALLPENIYPAGDHYCGDSRASRFYLDVEQDKDGWVYFYTNGEENVWHKYPGYDTEANARANLLLYLLENGYIKPEELNTK